MANARIVLAQGLVDGSNRVFATGEPYVAGSTAYILNGRIHNRLSVGSDFGFIELDPDAGTIQVDVAPVVDDVVQIFYWSRKVAPPPAITRLAGVVDEPNHAEGVVREPRVDRLSGVITAKRPTGVIRERASERLTGQVSSQRVTGVVKEKCP